jgi:probable rRNA maturation factor
MADGLLGDLVVCVPKLQQEAKEQRKLLEHHWAHILVHGVLHLLGFDHIDPAQAKRMEKVEVRILKKLNIADPYKV